MGTRYVSSTPLRGVNGRGHGWDSRATIFFVEESRIIETVVLLDDPSTLVLTSMKRTAAILGPTPPFLRWTIALPCPLRDLEAKTSLPDVTFRQLRSLRALSVGETQSRVKEGFCLHPDTGMLVFGSVAKLARQTCRSMAWEKKLAWPDVLVGLRLTLARTMGRSRLFV